MRHLAVVGVLCACGSRTLIPGDAPPDDAQPPNDAEIDAGNDAAVVDAMPDALVIDFDLLPTFDFGVIPANWLPFPQVGFVSVHNLSAVPVTFTSSVTGGFSIGADGCAFPGAAPGETCNINIGTPATSLGPVSGTITVAAGGTQKSAQLSANVEGWVDVSPHGPGSTPISPPSTDCGGHCYPGGTVLMMTEQPDPGATFIAWSERACNSNPSCMHVVDEKPFLANAAFTAQPAAFAIDIAGDGDIEVQVFQGDIGLIATCTASCSMLVLPDEPITVVAATPDDFGTFSAPCAAGLHACDLPAGTASVSVDAHRVAGERDLYPFASPTTIYSIDFDAAGDVALGTSNGVVVLDPAFAQRWTAPLVGTARFAPDGSVFVVNATGVHKLDASGSPLWTVPGGFDPPMYPYTGHPFAPTASGGFAIATTTGSFTILDPAGNVVATPALTGRAQCIAGGADGTIYVGVAYNLDLNVKAFAADGTPQADVPFGGEEAPCSLAVGTNQIAITQASEFSTYMFLVRDGVDRSTLGQMLTSDVVGRLDWDTVAVALDPADNTLWYHAFVTNEVYYHNGLTLTKITPTGTTAWSIIRPPFSDYYWYTWYAGLEIWDIAVARDGRIGVAGVYHGLTGDRGIVEVFPP